MIQPIPGPRRRSPLWPAVGIAALVLVAVVATSTVVGDLHLATTAAHRVADPSVVCPTAVRP
jgi:hypothetical protein